MVIINKKIIILLSVFLLLSSCQATPDRKSVVGKNDGVLEKALTAKNKKSKYNAPEKWKESFEIKPMELTVNIDAPVTVPDVDAFPVYSVTPNEMSEAFVGQFIEVLFGGAEVYEVQKEEEKSQEDYDNQIKNLLDEIANPSKSLQEETPEIFEDYKQEILDYVKILENEKKQAPKKYIPIISDRKYKLDGFGMSIISVEAKLKKNTKAHFSAIRSENFLNSTITFENYAYRQAPGGTTGYLFDGAKGLKSSKGKAAEIAFKYLKKLNIKNMDVAAIGTTTDGWFDDWGTDDEYDDMPKCFQFFFSRKLDGIQTNPLNTRNFDPDSQNGKDSFSALWPEESIRMKVDGDDIIDFEYYSPYNIGKKLSENVALLPFEEIQERFKQQMKISGFPKDHEDIIHQAITIDKIQLGFAKIPVKGKPEEGMLVPVWDFYGNHTEEYSRDTKDEDVIKHDYLLSFTDSFYRTYLSINAIDGSIIYRAATT